MRVVIAVDSFKGSVSATAAARAIAAGWSEVRPGDDLDLRPMADGGEGTVAAFIASGARPVSVRVTGPAGAPVDATWAWLDDTTAVIELASTSGIELLGSDRHPFTANTLGFGQAIAAALDAGANSLVLGIGSSASTDGGAGLLTALGARLLDANGVELDPPTTAALEAVVSLDLTHLRPLPAGGVTVLSDVTSPLLGPHGAATVFGPQKGASTPAAVARLEAALTRWSSLFDLDPTTPGAGAAGGAGYGLLVWGATLIPGAAEIARVSGAEAAVATADLVITGEGSYDAQSAFGKVPALITALASGPVALVAGRIAPDADLTPFRTTLSLTELAGSSAQAMAVPEHWLRAAGAALAQGY